MDLGTLTVRIGANLSDLSAGLQKAQAQVSAMGGKMQAVGGKMQAVGAKMSLAVTAPIMLMAKRGVEELNAIEAANAQTHAALQALGKGSLITAGHVQAQAAALQELSGADDQAIQSAQNLLLRFANLNVKTKEGADAFDRAAKLAVDMGVTMGGPEAAARKLGKSLADPENAMTRLGKEAGLTKVQMETLKKRMEEADSPAQKQAILMGALESKYKGAGAAAGETFAAKMAILGDKLDGVAATLVGQLTPAISKAAEWLSGLATRFENLSPGTKKVIAVMLALAAAIGPVLVIAGTLVSAIGSLMPVLAALTGPIGLIIVGAVALGAALVVLWKENEDFRQKVQETWAKIEQVFTQVFASLKATITTWVGWAKAYWKAYGDETMTVVKTVFGKLAGIIGPYLNTAKEIILAVMAVLRGDWDEAWSHLKGAVKSAFTAVTNYLELIYVDLPKLALKIGEKIAEKLADGAMGLVKLLGDLGSKAGGALADALKAAINAVISKWNAASIPGVSVKGKQITPTIDLPNLPTFARGGITSGPSIAGEAGPEAVIPLGGGAMARSDRARVMGQLGMGGGVTVNQHFHGGVVDQFVAQREAWFAFRSGGLVRA